MSSTELQPRFSAEAATRTAFLVVDCESIPDGKLLNIVKYPGLGLTDEAAVERAREEARQDSRTGSDFIPYTFQIPVAVCVARVAADFSLQAVACLDAPLYRPREIVEAFWRGVARYNRAKLVTFNGRGFDLPLLELAAFRYGCGALDYFQRSRNRYNGGFDMMDWLSNYGAYRLSGGLNLLSKILGKPGKMQVTGDQVYGLYLVGKVKEINDYCLFDTLDTYFVFLRLKVLSGDLTLRQEYEIVQAAKAWIGAKVAEWPALAQYLENWGDWQPWP